MKDSNTAPLAATEEDFNTEFTEDTEVTEKKARTLSLSCVFSAFSVLLTVKCLRLFSNVSCGVVKTFWLRLCRAVVSVVKSASRAATKLGIGSTEITEPTEKNPGITFLFLRLLGDLCEPSRNSVLESFSSLPAKILNQPRPERDPWSAAQCSG